MINGFLFAFVFLIVINLLKKRPLRPTLKKKKKNSFLYILGDYNID